MHERVKEAFISDLKKKLKKTMILRVSYPKIISRHHFDRLSSLILTEDKVIGGQRDGAENKIGPTVFTGFRFWTRK